MNGLFAVSIFYSLRKCLLMNAVLSRVNQNLLFFVLIVVVLYFGKPVLVPLMLGALLAMLMAPVCQSLDNLGFPRSLSSAICILILAAAIAGIVAVIFTQIQSFIEDLNLLEAKAKSLLNEIQVFIEKKFSISKKEQENIAKEQVKGENGNGSGIGSAIVSSLTSTVATMILMLVYTFLFIYNKEKFETFFVKVFHDEDTDKVKNIVSKVSLVGQKYLTGRAMSVIILTVLYSVALLIIGLDNAILLGGIAALLTIIPYVGTTLGGMFPFIVALLTEDSVHPALMVGAAIIIIQTIDNYFIEPNVVGGEVNLSALASILSIIVGGAVWGVAGMILFLPMIGILKIIFDHVESLKPFGFIIGDSREVDKPNIIQRLKETFRKKEEVNEP
jgi:predicted PurR-regulated permease PerM